MYTHEIIRIERGETKGSKSPMWRCQTKDGQRVNVFQHRDPHKDNTMAFELAGYFNLMNALKVGEALEWSEYPIQVMMSKVGDWWEINHVGQKPAEAEPDVLWKPNLELYRKRAIYQANQIVNHAVRVFDVETTGLKSTDEMISIAILDEKSDVCFHSMIKPAHPEKLLRIQKDGLSAADLTGISPEMLNDAPTFADVWQDIHRVMDGCFWAAYNSPFDCGALDRACSDSGMPLLTTNGVFDVAVIVAEYLGKWNEKRQWFEIIKLSAAAEELGVGLGNAHDAGADAEATLAILKAIARDSAGFPF